MIRRPPRSTQGVSSAASDVYKRQSATSYKQSIEEHVGMIMNEDNNKKIGQFSKNRSLEAMLGYAFSQVKLDLCFVYKMAVSYSCLLYTSPSPRDQRGSRMPSSA
eukprot:TRINITY_DN14452_c0_g1_i1.p2 TRINITY_DN14452_c0_g1~~TRINITY_DN14452_c0_g1_i1.p2  ORF type:complete len:105 (+),score=53.85 TRINITY_DN14452_c0_g1_i1:3-317(+)